MLICVDPKANSNKFYEVILEADGTVRTRYGRVGEPGSRGVGGHGRSDFDKIIRSKQRKGYEVAEIAGQVSTGSARNSETTKTKARADLLGDVTDARLTSLVDRLVSINAHEIATLSGGKMTVRDGQVATPLGLLTIRAIDEASGVLDRLAKKPTDPTLLSRYLTLVPQSVGRSRDWTESFFSGTRTPAQQRDFLDQLRQSVLLAQTPDPADDQQSAERAFAYSLRPVTDKKVIKAIEKMYASSRNAGHVSSSMRLVNVYETSSEASEQAFDATAAKVGNVKRMWHGTRAHNVLSILATGMTVPPRFGTTIQTAGRMFGDGIYFSEQSTKSLNYSRGGVWSSGRDAQALMFVADVAMGREYHPNRHPSAPYNRVLDGKVTDPKTGKPFTSINVKAGTLVRNHEAIVPGPSHVALRYLCEFSD